MSTTAKRCQINLQPCYKAESGFGGPNDTFAIASDTIAGITAHRALMFNL